MVAVGSSAQSTHIVPDRVAVVGAGMVGLATAWFLQEAGIEVTVLDREGVAAGASWGNAGWLTPGLATPLPEPAVLKYGIGAVLSGLAAGALRQLPLWPVTVLIVVGWGLSLLPFGFDVPTAVTVVCFAIGGAVYGPFVALSVTLMQAKSPPQHLAAMLAARSAVLLTASPVGTALGGPLTTALGPRATLGGSGLATVVLGVVAGVLLARRRRQRSG